MTSPKDPQTTTEESICDINSVIENELNNVPWILEEFGGIETSESEGLNKTKRFHLSRIYNKDKDYIVNSTSLAIKTIQHLKQQTPENDVQINPIISITEPSGSGKTCFFECTEELSELDEDNVHYKLASSTGLIEDAKKVFDNVLVMNISFKEVLKRVSTMDSYTEENFIIKLSLKLISLLENKALILDKEDCEYNKRLLETYKTDLPTKITRATHDVNLKDLIQTHKNIIIFIMKGITEGIFYKRQKHLEKNENLPDETKKKKLINSVIEIDNKPYKRIEKAVLLIDEVNIFKIKEIYSNTVTKGFQHRNFYVQIIEDAMKMDILEQSTSNLAFIFSSISPLSQERNSISNRLKILDFYTMLIGIDRKISFAEITFRHFYEISKKNNGADERNNIPNKLQILINDLKTDKMAIVNYFKHKKNTEEKELKEKIEEIFGKDYNYKEKDQQTFENEIILRAYRFFSFLFKQTYFGVKHNYNQMQHYSKKQILSPINENTVPDIEKLNCSQFLTFLMCPKRKGSICLYSKLNPSTENNMESFWHDFRIFQTKFEEAPFPRPISEREIKILYGPVDKVSRDSVSQTIYNTFHYGYTSLKPIKLIGGKPVFELDFANYQQKINIQKQYKEYLDKNKRPKLFKFEQIGELAETFTLLFWKGIMTKVKESVNIHMIPIGVEIIDEPFFRNATKRLLKKILPEKIEIKCQNIPREKIKKFFRVLPEVRVNKNDTLWQKTKKARIDLLVTLESENSPLNRCVVVIELKINNGKPKDLGTLKEFNKNYQTLDLYRYGHKLFVSASLNKKGSVWAAEATTMEYFIDNKI